MYFLLTETIEDKMSMSPSVAAEEDTPIDFESSPAPTHFDGDNDHLDNEDNEHGESEHTQESQKKRKKTTKGGGGTKRITEEALQRRREGRLKAAATIANNLKKTGIGRVEDENGFPYTSIKPIPLVNQKNYFTEYLKRDDQIAMNRKLRGEQSEGMKTNGQKRDEDEENDDENEDENSDGDDVLGLDTIVFHPGSRNLRIGKAFEEYPISIPMVVAVPTIESQRPEHPIPERVYDEEENLTFGPDFESAKSLVTKDFRARMRYYKRRMNPNSRDSAAQFNGSQKAEIIADSNNPDDKTYLPEDSVLLNEKQFFAGEEALSLPFGADFTTWKLRRPIKFGQFNQDRVDYALPQEVLCDLERILRYALKKLDIGNDFSKFKCMLVIPDIYDKMMVENLVNILLTSIGMAKIGVIQEGVAATFGTGTSCACVVDVGAEKTSISCVDEGMIVSDSRVYLNYGGDHITEAFTKILLQQKFPYKDINFYDNSDWELAERLKQKFGTFDDAEIAVQLYHFFMKKPGDKTKKYQFKVYDETMLAPLGLFYPNLFQIPSSLAPRRLFPESIDHYSGEPNNPFSKAQENLLAKKAATDLDDIKLLSRLVEERHAFKLGNPAVTRPDSEELLSDKMRAVSIPLDKAIIESITNAGIALDFNKARKLYDNILVVGGGLAKFPAFEALLNDRINIWRPRFLSITSLEELLTSLTKNKEKLEARRKTLIAAAKSKKKSTLSQEEVELTSEELDKIEKETKFTIDLEHADAVAEQGQVFQVSILSPPKELEPEMICWKGGSVFARLKVAGELWIAREDWDLLNSRCLYYKCLFNY